MREVAAERAEAVEKQLARLEAMSLLELREFWSSHWGYAPRLRSVALLRHMIAWRLQSELFGGLSAETRMLLKRTSTLRPARPPSGTRITREYRGVLHQVEVRETTFSYAGREFDSLTAIASEITGTHWNGPRFFGLRPQDHQK